MPSVSHTISFALKKFQSPKLKRLCRAITQRQARNYVKVVTASFAALKMIIAACSYHGSVIGA